MVNNYTTKELTELIYDSLEPLGYETVLSNPTTESKFPAIVINTPLESVVRKINTEIVQKRFQISIECWDNKKYKIMEMAEEVSQILIKYNFRKTNTSQDIFDEVTKKYRMIITFEVTYNGITHSFM